MMKYKLFIIILFFPFIIISGQSKTNDFVGAHFTFDRYNIRGDATVPMFENDWKSKLNFGISYLHFFNRYLGFEADLDYRNIGCGYKDNPKDGVNDHLDIDKVDLQTDLKYFNLPLMFILKPLENDIFNLAIGGYVSHLISGNLNGNPVQYNQYFALPISIDLTENINRNDFGFLTGVGSNIPINNNLILGLNCRYYYGLANLDKEEEFNYKNSFLSLSFGIMFRLDD